MNPRRMYRSHDRQLAGVAGGMAEYLDVDPTVIRIGWILITIVTGGLGLIAYLLLALVIPTSPYPAGPYWPGQPAATGGWAAAGPTRTPGSTAGWAGAASGGPAYGGQGPAHGGQGWQVPPTMPQWQSYPASVRPETRGLGAAGIAGIVLVVIGALALIDVVVPGIRAGAVIGPAVLLALGAALVASSVRRRVDIPAAPAASSAAAPGAARAWDSIPADMAPWTPAGAAPAAPAGIARPTPSADPEATSRDVPTVAAPAAPHPTDAA